MAYRSPKKMIDDAISEAGSERPRDVLQNLPIVSEPRCNVCKSEFRPMIDRMIAGPYTYAAIARQFIGKDQFLSGDVRNRRDFDKVRKSVERHAKQHVTVRDQAIREIIEQRAIEAGILVDDVKSTYLTTEALLELYLKKGFDQVTNDGSWVKHQDVLKAVEMIEQMRRDRVGEELEVLKKQVTVISQAVREIVPPELHPLIVDRAHQLMEMPVIDLEKVRTKEITA